MVPGASAVSAEAKGRQLSAAYDAAKQCFTLLFALMAAAVAADATVIGSAVKDPVPRLPVVAIGGVIVLLAVWGAILLGRGVGSLGVTILRLEQALEVPPEFSPAYALLRTFEEEDRLAVMDAVGNGPASAAQNEGKPPALFSLTQWPVRVASIIGLAQLALAVPGIDRWILWWWCQL